jgi:hypothetical protein
MSNCYCHPGSIYDTRNHSGAAICYCGIQIGLTSAKPTDVGPSSDGRPDRHQGLVRPSCEARPRRHRRRAGRPEVAAVSLSAGRRLRRAVPDQHQPIGGDSRLPFKVTVVGFGCGVYQVVSPFEAERPPSSAAGLAVGARHHVPGGHTPRQPNFLRRLAKAGLILLDETNLHNPVVTILEVAEGAAPHPAEGAAPHP